MNRFIEVCCSTVQDVIAAKYGGARRIELCSGLGCGGLTPSAGLITGAIREKGDMKVNVLIRPRPGNFIFTRSEVSVMEADVAAAKAAGADGVVIGALTEQGLPDMDVLRRLMKQAEGMDVTFHRAFDDASDPQAALKMLIEAGVNRVLTSGCQPSAPAGTELIADLVKQAAGRIIIMPGAGINPGNIAQIEAATGATEFHSTATDKIKEPAHTSPLFGSADPATDTGIVEALVNN